ncbi:MAG: cysteine desulfurase [Clostridiales bacterium]|nr:cysteine desulfurase [Clostridiales bacterium]
MIYADHAATSPLLPAARSAMEPWLEQFANPSSQYRAGLAARRAVEQARRQMAELLGCRPEELYFTSGGSEGNSWAIHNGALLGRERGRGLAVSAVEHHSLLRASAGASGLGIRTVCLPVDGTGRVLPDALAALPPPALVSVQYANNEVGTLQPVQALAEQAHRLGAVFHTDAVQAVGHVPVDLTGIDLLTASAHKFGGPKGVGFLYARRGIRLRPLIYGGSQEQGLRGGTESAALISGMAAALTWSMEHRETEARRLTALAQTFRATLQAGCSQVTFPGPEAGTGLPGLVSVTLPGLSAEQAVYRLDMAGSCVSAGAACDQRGRREPSHVLTAMGLDTEQAQRTLRISFGSSSQEGDGRALAEQVLSLLS